MNRTPVNLISGFLGVGKTTAMMKLLATKPQDEYWAVVVNEFGEVGIDGASLSVAGDGLPVGDIQVAEVPGGCICCTTSPMLRVTLTKLLKGKRPDRLLIEPSGLGHPAGIIDLLRDPFLAAALDVRAVLTLLDARHLQDSRYSSHETWRDQLQLADVIVLSKADLADVDQMAAAWKMAEAMFPPKLAIIQAVQGEFDPALLDLELHPERWPVTSIPNLHSNNLRKRVKPAAKVDEDLVWPIKKSHSALGSHSCGWIFSPETLFFSAKLADLFDALSQPQSLGLAGLARAKGVFHTERDWYRFDWVDGMPGATTTAYRRDSRFEVIVSSDTVPDWAAVEAAILAAMI
jgi:G3E family GTPase